MCIRDRGVGVANTGRSVFNLDGLVTEVGGMTLGGSGSISACDTG